MLQLPCLVRHRGRQIDAQMVRRACYWWLHGIVAACLCCVACKWFSLWLLTTAVLPFAELQPCVSQFHSRTAPHRTTPQTVRCAHCGMFVSNPQSLFSTHLALVAGIVSCLVLLWLRSANMRLHAALLRMPVAISIVIFDCLFICILIPTLATHQCSCAEMHFTSYYRLFLQQQLLKEENCSQHSVMGFYFQ